MVGISPAKSIRIIPFLTTIRIGSITDKCGEPKWITGYEKPKTRANKLRGIVTRLNAAYLIL